MWVRLVAIVALGSAIVCRTADAHPVPFSYIDARVESGKIELTIVVHTFDVANDLKIQPPEKLLERETLSAQGSAIIQLVQSRLTLTADGEALRNSTWSAPEGVPD